MKDKDKTKEQLIKELVEMRQRIPEMEHLSLVLRATRNVNQLIIKERDRDRLLKGICHTLAITRGYYNVWVALLDESGKLVTYAESGLGDDFLPMIERLKLGELSACGRRALTQSEAVVTRDPVSTCTDCPLSHTCAAGIGALAVRLEYGERVYGLLNASIPTAFITGEETTLFKEVASDIAFALHDIELEEAHKQAEEEIREAKEQAEQYLSIAEVILATIDADENITLMNKKGYEILGYKEGELIDKNWFDTLIPQRIRGEIREVFNKLMAGDIEPVEYYENPLLTKDGEERLVAFHNTVLRNPNSEIVGVLLSAEDITERKRAEEALRESEERYRVLFEQTLDGVVIIDENMKALLANKAAMDMFGIDSEEELLEVSLPDFIHPENRERALRIISEDMFKNDLRQVNEFRCMKKTGEEIWVGAVGALIEYQGKMVGLVSFRDTTERRQMEEERQKMEKLESVGTLAGGIAHDFNNILTGIMGNISLAKRYVEPGSKAADRLLEAEKASLRAKDLTQQLLTFARGGAPVKKTASIAELIEESASFALRGSNARCQFSLPDDLLPVEVDEGQLNQVITNLTINADEAMPKGGIINIGAENTAIRRKGALPLPTGKYVEITIADHGVGVPQEHLGRIFDPYFTTKKKGSGLGLATAYSIIKSHDGYITVDSELTVGTTFHIYLPASTKRMPRKKKEAALQPALLGKGRVLVMDDEEMLREMLNRMLSLAGYEVELTGDGAEAIERYAEARESGQPFDVVIMDLTIPGGMGGKEAIKKLLEIDPDARVIVSSGYATDPIIADYQKYGFSGVTTKPYSAAEMERILHSVLGRKEVN